MSSFAAKIGHATGFSSAVSRATTVLGADTTPAPAALATQPKSMSASMKAFLHDVGSSRPRDVQDGIGTLIGAGLGAYIARDKHWVLGAIGGGSLARNLWALRHPDDRKFAIRNLLITGVAIVGTLYVERHTKKSAWKPAAAFVGSTVAATLAADFVKIGGEHV